MRKQEEVYLNFGPQHPSTHGVMKLRLKLEGERVLACEPVIGQLHRGLEKLAEGKLYGQFIPFTDRLDYLAAAGNNLGYVLAVEKLLDIQAPERGQYIRVIIAELQRIASHMVAIGSMGLDLGAWTALIYTFRDREHILDLFEMFCGARLTLNAFRVGGSSYDFTPEFITKLQELLEFLPAKVDEYEALLTKNPIWLGRTKDVGIVSAKEAVALGLTGPNLRASGVKYDLRKDAPYEIYDRLDFDVPLGTKGDVYDRYLVRILEIRESLKMVQQALAQLPEGDTLLDLPGVSLPDKEKLPHNFPAVTRHFHLLVQGFSPAEQEIYCAVENPKGELGFYLVSDGSGYPYRLKIRAPSFIHCKAIEVLSKGVLLPDLVAIVASFDPVMGEVDR